MTVVDHSRAMAMLKALDSDLHAAESVVIAGEPVSKQRPRFGRGGAVYTPASLRVATDAMRSELARFMTAKLEGNVAVACIFFRSTRHSVDTDNLVKFALDAATGVCWHDDRQVTGITAVLEYDPDRPRTVLSLARHESTMLRGVDTWVPCGHCGQPFDQKRQPVKFCSPECRVAARGVDLSEPVPCAECGEPFRRPTSSAKLCSEACRRDWLRGRHRARRSVHLCSDCGKPVSKAGYQRCRDCWREAA